MLDLAAVLDLRKNQKVILKPQDLLLVLKFATLSHDGVTTGTELAKSIGLSATEGHKAIKRALQAQLLVPELRPTIRPRGRPSTRVMAHRAALIEFVLYGVRYVFVPDRGRIVRGVPTASAAHPLRDFLEPPAVPPVWPDPRGTISGESFSPLYPSAVRAARDDADLYALLSLVDAIRGGSARDRELANRLFAARVRGP